MTYDTYKTVMDALYYRRSILDAKLRGLAGKTGGYSKNYRERMTAAVGDDLVAVDRAIGTLINNDHWAQYHDQEMENAND